MQDRWPCTRPQSCTFPAWVRYISYTVHEHVQWLLVHIPTSIIVYKVSIFESVTFNCRCMVELSDILLLQDSPIQIIITSLIDSFEHISFQLKDLHIPHYGYIIGASLS